MYSSCFNISIHKALAGLDERMMELWFPNLFISIHKALAGLDEAKDGDCAGQRISIHKALAGLDRTKPVA